MTKYVTGMGNMSLDFIETMGGTATRIGGTCANVLAVMTVYGWQAAPVARLDDSAMSRRIVDLFAKLPGVDSSKLRLTPSSPPAGIVQTFHRRRNGTPNHRFRMQCGSCGARLPRIPKWTLAHLDRAMNAVVDTAPDVFVADRPSETITRIVDCVRISDTMIGLLPQRIGKTRWDSAKRAHCVSVSSEQVTIDEMDMLPDSDCPRLEVVTLGTRGLLWRLSDCGERTEWVAQKAKQVPVFADACGSGDWLAATLLHQIGELGASGWSSVARGTGRNDTIGRMIAVAQTAAAYNTQFVGARGSMTPNGLSQRIMDSISKGVVERPPENASIWPTPDVTVPACPKCPNQGSLFSDAATTS